MGRPGRRRDRPSVDAGHAAAGVFGHQGRHATCAHLLAQRGELDLDKPAAYYWPEFAAQGKADIPVRWLLSHRAGLPAIDNPIPLADLLAWDPMVAALAAQRPAWEPGTAHGYHGRTFGWLVGEVIRRVSGRSVGTFFAEEIAAPAGLDFYIGLPAPERGRVSRMIIDDPPGAEVARHPAGPDPRAVLRAGGRLHRPRFADGPGLRAQHAGHRLQCCRGAGRADPLEQRDLHRGGWRPSATASSPSPSPC